VMKTILKTAFLVTLAVGMLFLFSCGTKNDQAAKDTAKDTAVTTDSVTEERKTDLEAQVQSPVVEKAVDVSKEDLLKELASLEKTWAADLHRFILRSDELTDKWISGEMSYNQYIIEFLKYKTEFGEFYNIAENVYKEKDFVNILRDEPLYKNRLVHGKQLRDTVKVFFDTVYEGKKDANGKIIDVSGEKYKELYNEMMIKQYNEHYGMLRQM
jgi:hypothetical protein